MFYLFFSGDLRSGSEYGLTEELLAAHAIMRRDIEAQLRRELMIERELEIIKARAGLAFFRPIAILLQPLALENGLSMMDRVLHRALFPGFKDSEILASMGGDHGDSTVAKPRQNGGAPSAVTTRFQLLFIYFLVLGIYLVIEPIHCEHFFNFNGFLFDGMWLLLFLVFLF